MISLDYINCKYEIDSNCYFSAVVILQILIDHLSRHLEPTDPEHGHLRVSSEKKIHMAVWYLSNQETFRQMANLFGLEYKSNAHLCIMQVLRVMAEKLKDQYIRWPDSIEQQIISTEFQLKTGFPNVIGCIDGTHIAIKPPAADRDSYINRKGFPSVNVMAVCDHRFLFTSVFADRAGSVHDARVLRVSPLGNAIENGRIGHENYHILGDSAYPLLTQLIVPYRDNGHLTTTQIRFNYVHSETRSVIERAFARLKGKLRRLRHLENTVVTNALAIIDAAFILHNFMILHDSVDFDYELDIDDSCTSEGQHVGSDGNSCATSIVNRQLAVSKRDRIASML